MARPTENEQKLVNIAVELVLAARTWEGFQDKSKEEVAEWVSQQLGKCGFQCEPLGCSWAVLSWTPD